MAHLLTTCTFCGVGCGLYLETAGNRVVGVYPSLSHPTNQGRICVRGWNVHEVVSSPDRLTTPLLRKQGDLAPVSWTEALDFIAGRLEDLRRRYGSEALAFYNAPRCSNEETYLLQKFARAVMGTNNVDHGAGVYANNSIQVLLEMLGTPATTNAIGDLARSELIVVDGVDLCRQLPTVGGRVLQARSGGAKLIVIDTRRHRLAEGADLFLQLKPGTEILLYGAMAKVILDRGLRNLKFIKAHCQGYPAFLEALAAYDLLAVAECCAVPAELIERAALMYAQAGRAAWLFSTGIEGRSKDSLRAVINLVLMTGNLGRPGTGIYALTEQNNGQGVSDMGMAPDRFPGYQPVTDHRFRRMLEQRWHTTLPGSAGIGARRLLTSTQSIPIKGLWLARYDPVSTAFFGDPVRTLQAMELLVVQHLFLTETARHAHVVLPVTAFGEERVTFTSTDRRIQIAEQIIDPPPGPMPGWQQLTELARRMGVDWGYRSAADVMDEIGEVVPFYSGASYENLGRDYGRQWPCTKDKPLGTRDLFEDGLQGRPFKFIPVPRPVHPWPPSADRPFALVFGHSLYYWHQNVLIQHSETLKREYRILLLDYPDGFVEINDTDAGRLGLRNGEKIRLVSSSGMAHAAARITGEVKPGTVFVPYFVREVQRQILGSGRDRHDPVYVRVEKE